MTLEQEYYTLVAAYGNLVRELNEQKGYSARLEKLLQDWAAVMQEELSELIQQGKVGQGGSGGMYQRKF